MVPLMHRMYHRHLPLNKYRINVSKHAADNVSFSSVSNMLTMAPSLSATSDVKSAELLSIHKFQH